MLLGIFDVFHINEFNGKITNWVEVLVTILGAGAVAWFAAFLQNCNQKKRTKNLEAKKEANERIYLKHLIVLTIQELSNNKVILDKNFKPSEFGIDYQNNSNYKLFNYSASKILSLDNSQTFNVLLSKKQSEDNIKLYANFLVAVDSARVSVSLAETDLKNHDIKNVKLHKAIVDLYDEIADVINQVNRENPGSNSVFDTNNESGKKIQNSFNLMYGNPKINPLVFISDVVDFVISNIENDKVYDREYGAYEKYFIPLKTLLLQVIANNRSLNTKIKQRITELERSRVEIVKFQKILK